MNPPPYSAHSQPQSGFNVQPTMQPGYNVQPGFNVQPGINGQPTAQPVPLNLGVAQPLNANPYGYQPVVQPPINVLNATPRTYSYWPWRRYGPYNRRASYIAIGVFSVFVLISVVIFLIVFFTIMKKHDDFVEESHRRQQDFHDSFFNH